MSRGRCLRCRRRRCRAGSWGSLTRWRAAAPLARPPGCPCSPWPAPRLQCVTAHLQTPTTVTGRVAFGLPSSLLTGLVGNKFGMLCDCILCKKLPAPIHSQTPYASLPYTLAGCVAWQLANGDALGWFTLNPEPSLCTHTRGLRGVTLGGRGGALVLGGGRAVQADA